MTNNQMYVGSAPVNFKAIARSVLPDRPLPVDEAAFRITKSRRASPAWSPRTWPRTDRTSDDATTPRSQRDEYECSSYDAACIIVESATTTPQDSCSDCKQEDLCTLDFGTGTFQSVAGPSYTTEPSPFLGYPRVSTSSDSGTEGSPEELISSLACPCPVESLSQPVPQQVSYPTKLLQAQAHGLTRIDLTKLGPKRKVVTCSYSKRVLAQLELPQHPSTFDVDLETVDLNEYMIGDADINNIVLSNVDNVQQLLGVEFLPNGKTLLAWEPVESLKSHLDTWKKAAVDPPTSSIAVTLLGVVNGIKGMHRAGFVHGNIQKSAVGTSSLGGATIKQGGLARKLDRSAPMVGSRATAAPEVS